MIQCIESTEGSIIKGGYHQVSVWTGRHQFKILSHRMAFEKGWGIKLQPDEHVMHTCDNPACVNPLHLMRGDRFANMQDMARKGRHWQQGKTHCKWGHEFTEANTYLHNGGKHRKCKKCRAERARGARHG